METPRSSLSTRGEKSPIRAEDGRGLYDNEDDDDENWTRQQRGRTSTNSCNRRLSFDRSFRKRGQVLEIRTHAPLEKMPSLKEEGIGLTKLLSGSRRLLTR